MTDTTGKKVLRRGILKSCAVILAGGTIASQTRAQDAEKLAQNLVQYQETPKGDAKCSGCVNYIDPGACKIVAGKINPNGWCVAYAPKNG